MGRVGGGGRGEEPGWGGNENNKIIQKRAGHEEGQTEEGLKADPSLLNSLIRWSRMIFARWLGYKQEEILITGDGCRRSEDFVQPEMSSTSWNSGTETQ